MLLMEQSLAGVVMGVLAPKRGDKFTMISSPSIICFGLLVEQLIPYSTGREGLGVVPVVGKPLASPAHSGGGSWKTAE